MARRAGLLRNRLNERTLLSWARTNESLPAADSSSPVIAVMQPAHALLASHCTVFQRACPASRRLPDSAQFVFVFEELGQLAKQQFHELLCRHGRAVGMPERGANHLLDVAGLAVGKLHPGDLLFLADAGALAADLALF